MSLILDALKRAERERQADPTPVLGDATAPQPRRRRRLPWRLLGFVALAVIVGALAWTFKPNKPATAVVAKPAPTAPAPSTPPPQAPPQSAPQPAPPPIGFVLPPVTAPPPARPAPAPAPLVIPGTESVASLDDVAAEEPPPEELVPAAEPEPPVEEPKAAEPAPAEQPAPEPRPEIRPSTPPAQRPVPKALTQPAQYRKFREMPPDYRADFPQLEVQVHVYEPTQRFVIVNGRRYKDGERLAEGPQVVEIVRDGIVLEFRGEKVLYPINR